jgi:hypothetical protein
MLQCGRCKDGRGLYARPCAGCGRQKPLSETTAEVYGASPGDTLTPEELRRWFQARYPRWQVKLG